MAIKTLKDLDLKGQKVLMRVDFNVPLTPEGQIADDSRIRASLPSIEYILNHGASLILMSHLGRPKNNSPSLAPVAAHLSTLLHKPIPLAPDCIGPATETLAKNLQPGQILLLENLRFHPEEEKPTDAFVQALARLGQLYVNDAFGTAHRAHASTAAIAAHFPHRCAMGLLMEKELAQLTPLLHNPPRPFYALMGGAKISTKLGVIQQLLSRVDALFLGGAMVYTLLKSQNIPIGNSLCEDDQLATAKTLLTSPKIHLPSDLVIADSLTPTAQTRTIPFGAPIPPNWQGVDIGPQTTRDWAPLLRRAATLFWNGPLGVTEIPLFAKGTRAIATTLSTLPFKPIVGGGDSIAAITALGLADHFTLSTGGGASLELLEFGHLPGLDALSTFV